MRKQTLEWDKHQSGTNIREIYIFVKLWHFISSLRKMLILLFCWTKTVLTKICGLKGHFLIIKNVSSSISH